MVQDRGDWCMSFKITSPFCNATSHVPLSRVSLPPPPWNPPPDKYQSFNKMGGSLFNYWIRGVLCSQRLWCWDPIAKHISNPEFGAILKLECE